MVAADLRETGGSVGHGSAGRSSTTATPWPTPSSGASDYRWRHGEAVAIGMVFVAELARPPAGSTPPSPSGTARARAARAADDVPADAFDELLAADGGGQEDPRPTSCASWSSTTWPPEILAGPPDESLGSAYTAIAR